MSAAAKTVVEALSAVMGDVQAVGKDGRNTQQNYNFRGVDAVVNAVGPALRKHGVVVVPAAVTYDDERYQTKNGAQMRGVTATVTFRFYGPAGDFIEAQVAGESSDAGDKAMPKAHSVAFRTLLLEALCIPTDDPEPDAESHERHGRRVSSEGEPQAEGANPAIPVPEPAGRSDQAPSPSEGNPPSEPMKRKLNVLVGTLRTAGHITTEQLWMAVRGTCPADPHWSDLRDELTKPEAHELIERLTALEARVKEPAPA